MPRLTEHRRAALDLLAVDTNITAATDEKQMELPLFVAMRFCGCCLRIRRRACLCRARCFHGGWLGVQGEERQASAVLYSLGWA